jgi:hypothetical protein
MFAIGCRSFRGIGIVCVGDDAGLAQISQLAPEYVAGFSIKTVKFKSIIFVGDNPVSLPGVWAALPEPPDRLLQ